MDNNKQSKYFAALPSKDAVAQCEARIQKWSAYVTSNDFIEKIKKSWMYYHGSFGSKGAEHRLSGDGDQGELVRFPVNHYRNIGLHLLNMTTASRPAMQARASNTDYKSLTQTILANGLLDYYMREKHLEDYLLRATEYAIVFGEGYVKLAWNATAGKIIDEDEETGEKYYEGDLQYTNLSPLDVFRDHSKENNDHDWLITRTYKNRYDMMAKYPELEDKIAGLDSKEKLDYVKFPSFMAMETDDVPIYELFHRPSEALPEGRYLVFSDQDTVYYDGPLPYDEIPVYRMSSSDVLGTPYGYTILFDLLPIQEAINLLYSVIITNQNAFGVQNILIPKGADLNLSQLGGGLNILEYNITGGKPESLNLTNTPKEIFEMLEKLEQTIETISGINSVTRGQPEASLKSGAALALIQAQAVQFASSLQNSYVRLVENVGTAMIKILQRYAKEPRVAAIAGKANKGKMVEFSSEDLSGVNRVIVEIANPLSKTTAGRLEIANQLLQMQLIKNVDEYFTVLNTGKLDTMIEGAQAELLLIRSENERMMQGEAVQAIAFDQHQTHINEHKSLLADPELRKDPTLVNIALKHIQEHIDLLSNPQVISILMVTGQQPLQVPQPPGPPGAPNGGPSGPTSTAVSKAGPEVAQVAQPPQGGVEQAEAIRQPDMPRPPAPFQSLPTDPAQSPK